MTGRGRGPVRTPGRIRGTAPWALLAAIGLAVAPAAAQQTPPPPSAPPATSPPAAGQEPAPAPASPSQATATTRVTYISGPTVYVEAGRDDGIQSGDTLEVSRDGHPIAVLRVDYLSPHRAACSVVSKTDEIAVGDAARYTPTAPVVPPAGPGTPAAGVAPAAAAAGTGSTAAKRSGGLHGRVGVRYLSVKDKTGDAGFSQPALDLFLADYGLGPVDLLLDVRARRTYRAGGGDVDEVDSLNNVYRASAVWHPGPAGQTVTLGRQFAPSLSVVSLFDGVLYDWNAGRFSLGGFAGTQPEPPAVQFSSDIREYGGYWTYRSAPESARRWEITTGAVGSYEEGDPNREFVFVQGRYRGPELNVFAVEEIDFYRGWKVDDAGESSVSPSSTFASLTWQAAEHVTFYGGYDSRRNVRLFRDQVTPATEFDDSHRQGGWGGASFRLGDHFDLGADLRRSTGGPNGTADGYAFNAGFDRLTAANLSFTGRGTHYANEESDGWLYALEIGGDVLTRAHLSAGAGHLDETSAREPALDRTADWYDFEVDVLLGRRWLLLLQLERYAGDLEDNDQVYSSVGYRF